MWEKKNKILEIFFVVGIAIGFGCLLIWIKDTHETKLKIQKEEQKKYQEQLGIEIAAMIEDYAEIMEQELRKTGISDVEVVCTRCSQEEYQELFSYDYYYYSDSIPKKYTYYFIMEYQSDEIASICNEYIQKGKRIGLINLLKKCCDEKNRYAFVRGCTRGVFDIDEEDVDIYINDGMNDNELLLKTSDGQSYEYETYYKGTDVYKNDDCLLSIEKSASNSKPAKVPSSAPSYQPYIAYDPYDVYDYADGDDFADEWAEEFGDGDYDEGYDEAYDYWEDEME